MLSVPSPVPASPEAPERQGAAPPARRGTGGADGAVDRVHAAIRTAIIHGRYGLGQRLIEAELSAEYGVGRSSIREALRRLSGEGLVEIVRNKGAVVRRFTRAEIADFFCVRGELEALAARLAAEKCRNPECHAKFLDGMAQRPQPTGPGDVAGYSTENRQFHRLIVTLAGNKQLESLLEQLHIPILALQLWPYVPANFLVSAIGEHDEIAAAILAGDGPMAERLMRRHVRNSAGVVQRMPDEAFGT
jgi:DNA-binding GntR family transcriptional regulator